MRYSKRKNAWQRVFDIEWTISLLWHMQLLETQVTHQLTPECCCPERHASQRQIPKMYNEMNVHDPTNVSPNPCCLTSDSSSFPYFSPVASSRGPGRTILGHHSLVAALQSLLNGTPRLIVVRSWSPPFDRVLQIGKLSNPLLQRGWYSSRPSIEMYGDGWCVVEQRYQIAWKGQLLQIPSQKRVTIGWVISR